MGRNTKRQSRWNVNHKTRSGLVRWRYLGRQNRHPSSSVRVMSIGMYLQKSPGKKRCSVPRGGGLGADWHNSPGFWIAFAWNCSAICRIRNQTLVHFVSASSGTFPNCITALWLMLWLEPLIPSSLLFPEHCFLYLHVYVSLYVQELFALAEKKNKKNGA